MYQQALKDFTAQHSAVMARCHRWVEREEVADHHKQLEAERAAEELRKREAAKVAEHAEVTKGKRAEVTLLKRGEGSSAGRGSVVVSLGANDKDVVELYQGPEWCACCVMRGKYSFLSVLSAC